LVVTRTNFYAQSGGQVYDTGSMLGSKNEDDETSDFRVESVQEFSGYVLHFGKLIYGNFKVGDKVFLSLDMERRNPIMANHTSTHILNFALREVLGESSDQKGSEVAPEKFRFDYSQNNALSPEQIEKIENICSNIIRSSLPVYKEPVSLSIAKTITGLRAVFGEVYPDPVRVISIGASIQEILKDPTNPKWRSYSIEFCVGTHLNNSKEAGRFHIISDESISKGVRRTVVVTRDTALKASQNADKIQEQIEKLPIEIKSLEVSIGDVIDKDIDVIQILIRKLKSLEASVVKLTQDIDTIQIPLIRKLQFRQILTNVRNTVIKELIRIKKDIIRRGLEVSVQIAERVAATKDLLLITEIQLGSEKTAINEAIKNIQSKCPNTSIMLFSPDDESDQTTVYASVPGSQTKLKAGDWLKATLTEFGGKGGGQQTTGQGYLPGGRDMVAKAMVRANELARIT